MRKFLLVACVIFGIGNLQAQFGPAQLISLDSDTSSGKQFIRTSDVDGDGQLDIIVGSDFNNVVRYFHNTGNFSFASAVLIPGSWTNLQGIEMADLNNDGEQDLVTIDFTLNKLFWHPNIDGAFPQQLLISDNFTQLGGRILCNDFNGDGMIDIVVIDLFNASLLINDGNGNFEEAQSIVSLEDEEEFYDNVFGDFNNDNFLDIALAAGGFQIYLNDGDGNFTKTPGAGIAISFLIESADYNNDGLDDIIFKSHNTIIPYQNSATGFSIVGQFTPNNQHNETLFSSDLDNDGDLDILSEDDQTNAFFWYENINLGSSWLTHVVPTGFTPSVIHGVRAADLDGDGDNDLIRSSGNGDVAIYENQVALRRTNFDKSNFKIFPNPVRDILTIESNLAGSVDAAVFDLLGKKVLNQKSTFSKFEIDLSSIESGSYILKITQEGKTEMKKIIVVN